MSKTLGDFKLNVEEGTFTNCEIIVLLGENGTGKTTLVRLLSGDKKCLPDEASFDVNNIFILFSYQSFLFLISLKLYHQNSQELFKNYFTIN